MQWKTAITKIENNKEIVRGYKLEQLIKHKTFAEVIFLLLKGELPKVNEAKIMDAMLVAAIDHGVGTPSATVARTVASTKNSLHTAVAAGILAMGDLHGSAIEGAAKFFQENVNEKDVAALIKDLKDKKIRIPGFGHKVLAVDQRAITLLAVAKENKVYGQHCGLAEKIEEELNKISSKKLPLNIDGAMGAIISDLGFSWQIAKAFFVIARTPGLAVQAHEELASGQGIKRINEDEIEYIGETEKNLG